MSEGDRTGTERLDDKEHVLPGYANTDQVLPNPCEEVAEEEKLGLPFSSKQISAED